MVRNSFPRQHSYLALLFFPVRSVVSLQTVSIVPEERRSAPDFEPGYSKCDRGNAHSLAHTFGSMCVNAGSSGSSGGLVVKAYDLQSPHLLFRVANYHSVRSLSTSLRLVF